MGAWIEIVKMPAGESKLAVAPLVGAWIEIFPIEDGDSHQKSLPLWERGLKSYTVNKAIRLG